MKTASLTNCRQEGKSPYGNRLQGHGYAQICFKLQYADGTKKYFDFTSDLQPGDDFKAMVLSFLRTCEDFQSESGAPAIGVRPVSYKEYLAATKRKEG